jgi:hypothetical protein
MPSTDSAGLTATPRKKPRLGVDYSGAERTQIGRALDRSKGIGATDRRVLFLERSWKTDPLEAAVARENHVGKPYGITVSLVLNIAEHENDEDEIATQMAVCEEIMDVRHMIDIGALSGSAVGMNDSGWIWTERRSKRKILRIECWA